MISIINAVLAINPSANLSVNAEDFNQITWLDGTPEISKADIQAKQAELQAEYDAQDYARKRKDEYPPFGDQLDMQYHDKINGTTTWQDTIKAVKDNHPKGG